MKTYSDYWGWWFTGFVDGEGCFYLSRLKRAKRNHLIDIRPILSIRLRADDVALLEDCHSRFGGSLKLYDTFQSEREGNRNPSAQWRVSSHDGVATIIHHFETYPLKSKKARDFEIWRLAVTEYQKPIPIRDIEYLEKLRDALMKNRRYETTDVKMPSKNENQLRLGLEP